MGELKINEILVRNLIYEMTIYIGLVDGTSTPQEVSTNFIKELLVMYKS